MRADAVANRRRILAAAGAVFGELGAEAPTEEVARRAGVGIGTVFRHFPTKHDLVEATLVAHLDGLTAHAADLAASGEAGPALHALLREIARTGTAVPGSGPTGYPAADAASDALRAAVGTLLDRAQDAGDVRADVSADEVYFLIGGLARAGAERPGDGAVRRRAVDVVVDGLAGPVRPAQPGGRRR